MEKETESDYKKYFNPQEYVTQFIGIDKTDEENSDDAKEVTLLSSLLTDPKHKGVKEETLLTLKKEKKGEILLMAIAREKNKTLLPFLIAACWESEINFSKYLPFFVLLVLDDDYLVSLEAITVIEEMPGPFEKQHLAQAIEKIKEGKKSITSEKQVLLNDLLDTLNAFAQEIN